MLFKEYHAPMILSGRKTQTRRLWKRPMVKVGGIYSAQTGFCKPETAFARIRVLRLWKESLKAISEQDAKAEGYPSKAAFLNAFGAINHIPIVWVNDPVTCVEFEVVK